MDEGGSRIGRVLAVLAVLGIAVMWIYIYSGAASDDAPDELDDPAFARTAEPVCADTVAALDRLPPAADSETAADRAAVLDEANDLLAAMVDELSAIPVDDEADAELVELWLADWRRYLEDRRTFAAELATDPDAELLVTARGGRQITVTADRFAQINDMPSCATPLDA